MFVVALVGITLIALYLYAGHRTWEHMLLTDDDPGCIITREVRDGTLPPWLYHTFLALWAPLLVAVWLSDHIAPRTFP